MSDVKEKALKKIEQEKESLYSLASMRFRERGGDVVVLWADLLFSYLDKIGIELKEKEDDST